MNVMLDVAVGPMYAMIIGGFLLIACGVVLLVGVAALIIVLIIRRNKKKKADPTPAAPEAQSPRPGEEEK